MDHSRELLSHYKTIYNHNTVPIIILKEEDMDDKLIGGYTELEQFIKERAP